MAKLTVFNPVARSVEVHATAAARVPELNGKRIGLYWNVKAGGDFALERVEQVLRRRYPDARFAYHQGDVGAAMRHSTKAVSDRMARESDVVVGATGD